MAVIASMSRIKRERSNRTRTAAQQVRLLDCARNDKRLLLNT
jgi:hypothetical protein